VHTPYGKGRVIAVGNGLVHFEVDDFAGKTFRIEVQRAREQFKLEQRASVRVEAKVETRLGGADLLNAVDALRFGLVPGDIIFQMSMRGGDMEGIYRKAVPYDGSSPKLHMSLVEGEFGQGKSHIKQWIEKRAYDDGYLIANVQVDGESVAFYEQKTLLFTILRSLRGKGLSEANSVTALYQMAASKGYDGPRTYYEIERNQGNYRTVAALERAGLLAEVDDQLEIVLSSSPEKSTADVNAELRSRLGRGVLPDLKLFPLIGQTVERRPIDLMVALIAVADLAVAAGFKGLLITFDEWEVQESRAAPKKAQRVKRQLEAIKLFFTTDRIARYPIALMVFNVPGTEEERREAAGVKELVRSSGGAYYRIPHLEAWDRRDMELSALAGRVHDMYVKAYAIAAPLSAEEYLDLLDASMRRVDFSETGATRMMIKMMVSVLDVRYGPPQGC
jgi:hypothetical protein